MTTNQLTVTNSAIVALKTVVKNYQAITIRIFLNQGG